MSLKPLSPPRDERPERRPASAGKIIAIILTVVGAILLIFVVSCFAILAGF